MTDKKRIKPSDLQVLEILDKRMKLSKEASNYYISLKKGYEGELLFDTFTEPLPSYYLVLNDLLFQTNNITFQIDSLVITKNELIIYEVKNYEGEYIFAEEYLVKVSSDRKIINPLVQLTRTKTLLSQLIEDLNFHFSIKSYVVFTNQDFTLYQAPENRNLLFSTNIGNHVKQMNSEAPTTAKQKHLAKMLCDLHLVSSPYHNLPEYEFSSLKKEACCSACRKFLKKENIKQNYVYCDVCSHKELASEIILKQIEEFKLLFYKQKVTPPIIEEFCGNVFSQKRIRSVLKKLR